jgi:hypothetical protein
LSGKKPVTSAVLEALGLRKVYARQSGSIKMRRRKPSEYLDTGLGDRGKWASRHTTYLTTTMHSFF